MAGARKTLKKLIDRVVPGRYLRTTLGGRDAGVVLTFDDGPHPEWTPRALDVLDRFGVKATFFLVGEWALRHPDLTREIAARGHTIGDHTFSHQAVAGLGPNQLKAQVIDSAKRLSDLSGQDVRLFRPPWGKIDVRSALYLVSKGLQIVMWSVDSKDYEKSGADDILSTVESAGVGSGDIILMHDDNEHTVEALPRLIELIRGRGLKVENLKTV